MKKLLFVLPALSLLFLGGCTQISNQGALSSTGDVVSDSGVIENTDVKITFQEFLSGFLIDFNKRDAATMDKYIDIQIGVYVNYNFGAMPSLIKYSTFDAVITAYKDAWLGAKWLKVIEGDKDILICQDYSASLEDPQSKCDCESDTGLPRETLCKIQTLENNTTPYISEALSGYLSEFGTKELTGADVSQIDAAKEIEKNISNRVYLQQDQAVFYFTKDTDTWKLIMMDITDCCSA